jgi:hypothetical protein
MKAIAILFIALLVISPAVFARASSFYQTQSSITLRPTQTIASIQRQNVSQTYAQSVQNRTQFRGLTGIYGVSVQKSPSLEQPGQIGLFGKSWLRKQESPVRYPAGYVPVGGIANATPGISRVPCADFNCKASEYIVGDTSTKLFYRCWCDLAKGIKPENIKCLTGPGVATRIGYSEGKC